MPVRSWARSPISGARGWWRLGGGVAGRLRVLEFPTRNCRQRCRDGPVRHAEQGGHPELSTAQSAWCGSRDEHDLPELGHGPVDRDPVLPNDHGFGAPLPATRMTTLTAHGVNAADAGRIAHLLRCRCCSPRCSDITRCRRWRGRKLSQSCHLPDRADVLPVPELRPVRRRADRGVHVRDHRGRGGWWRRWPRRGMGKVGLPRPRPWRFFDPPHGGFGAGVADACYWAGWILSSDGATAAGSLEPGLERSCHKSLGTISRTPGARSR